MPDIVVDDLQITSTDDADGLQIKEADLAGHLEGDEQAQESAPATGSDKLASQDYALYEALNLLKGLTILKGENLSRFPR